ncbi:hypothetical protein G6F43_003616 [Rhizopus delemar]|nr:hypothetical protein G6F43_003616 [Rhizopus delemar]
MHFLPEALYRRPLEPRLLAYGRGATAITMSMLFLAFCGYLINLIYRDQPLIQNSSKEISNYIDAPDIEFCLQNSTMKVVHCSAMYYNWSAVPIDNCWENFFYSGANDDSTSKCWIFDTKGQYKMTNGLTYDNRDALRRLDFYWKIDNLYNVSYATISIPAMAIQLYDPKFSSWKPATIGDTAIEKMMLTNIQLGATRSSTMLNYTSSIYYTPNLYRAIRPRDAAATIGFTPNYIDIYTISNFQQNWPLADNPPAPPVNRSAFDGVFSVQLAQSTIDVKTEVRQHTLLASLALAGGCYGVLTTIYILFFGMTRLTPWGLVHHIPVFISKRKHKKEDLQAEGLFLQNQQAVEALKTNNDASSVPWFFRNKADDSDHMKGRSQSFVKRKEEEIKELEMNPIDEALFASDIPLNQQHMSSSRSKTDEDPLSDKAKAASPYPSSPVGNLPHSVLESLQAVQEILRKEQTKSDELNSRIEELEVILAEYFIDTSYVDQIRGKGKPLTIEQLNNKNNDLSS